MLKLSLEQLRHSIEHLHDIPDEEKQQLLSECQMIEQELQQLTQTHTDQAKAIASYLNASSSEDTHSFNDTLQELKASHPVLVSAVDIISRTLSRLGI